MLARLHELIIRVSRTWWLYLIVFGLFAGSLQALTRIGRLFPAHAAGAEPFDLQNDLRASEVYPQIAGYTEQARELYYAFTLIDYAFPFFAGLFIAATIAFALRSGAPGFYAALAGRRLLLLPMIGTLFDWLENATALSAILAWPAEAGWLATLLVLVKKGKLFFVLLSNAAMLAALLFAAGAWIVRRLRR